MHINYPIISLLKVKVIPNSESKLYNYNKISKCTNKKFKLLFLLLLIYYLCYYLYKNSTRDMCHHVSMYDGRDKNINSQTNGSLKYISNIYGGAMQNEIYCNLIRKICILEYVLEYLIDERGHEIDNYNY